MLYISNIISDKKVSSIVKKFINQEKDVDWLINNID